MQRSSIGFSLNIVAARIAGMQAQNKKVIACLHIGRVKCKH